MRPEKPDSFESSIVLSVAVLGIVITAPLGAFLMDTSAPKLLSKAEE